MAVARGADRSLPAPRLPPGRGEWSGPGRPASPAQGDAHALRISMSGSCSHPPVGLRRRTVVVRDHDPRWLAEYQREAAALAQILEGLVARIEHVGSTAVADLVAKPIIDIALGFDTRAGVEAARPLLQGSDYEDQGDLGEAGGVFLAKPVGPEGAVHLHLIELDSDQWRSWIAFRDALGSDERLRQRYGALKLELAKRYAMDRA